MAISMLEDHRKAPFAVRFVSQQDEENYSLLREKLSDIVSKNGTENILRSRDGLPVMSYMEYKTRELCPEVDAGLLPKQLMVPGEQMLRDYAQYNIGTLHLVSDKFKQIIESVEPGVHQFWPVELINEQGENLSKHYIFLCMGAIDAIIYDPCTKDKKEPTFSSDRYDKEDYYYYSKIGSESRPRKINKDLVQGRSCYRDIHWDGIEMIISDQVKEMVDNADLEGIRYMYHFKEC